MEIDLKKKLFADDATFAMDWSLRFYNFKIMSGINLNVNKSFILSVDLMRYTHI